MGPMNEEQRAELDEAIAESERLGDRGVLVAWENGVPTISVTTLVPAGGVRDYADLRRKP